LKYIVRLNPRAYNPLTRKIDPSRLWEVEQCADKDSGKVLWHCANVKINGTYIREIFVLPKEGEKPFERTYNGICFRGQDDAIEIREGRHDLD
jgi:hypothetical protein